MTGTEIVERFKGAIAADSRRAIAEAIDFMIAATHEACAQIADSEADDWLFETSENVACREIAAAIRLRGEMK